MNADNNLSAPLNEAVHAVKSQPVPLDATKRGIERARRIGRGTPSARGQHTRQLVAVGALAASLLFGLLFLVRSPEKKPAQTKEERAYAQLVRDLKEIERQDRASIRVFAPDESDSMHPDIDVADPNLTKLGDGSVHIIVTAGVDPKLLNEAMEVMNRGRPRTQLGAKPPDEAVGLPGAPEGAARTVSPPPGIGRGTGASDEGPHLPYTVDALRELGTLVTNKPSSSGESTWSYERMADKYVGEKLDKRTVIVPTTRDPLPVTELEVPQKDSTPGNVDLKKIRTVSENWGSLPELERAKAIQELTRDLPPKYREAINKYFEALGRNAEAKPIGETAKTDPDKPKETKKPEQPQVWKRNGPPTFARVFVGDGNSLELVSLRVSVTVEGPRARTLIDHVFRNPHDKQLEGTFEYPLPTGASPSYFAMFLGQTRDTAPPLFARRGDVPALSENALVALAPDQLVKHVNTDDWGRLQEARITSKEKALQTYEDVVRTRVDPALLEYAGGNTFRGRVFPIPARGYNRVLIAYEEELPVVNEQVRYRFPLPDCKPVDVSFALSANSDECKEPVFLPKDTKKEDGGGRLNYQRTWTGEGPGGEAVFSFTPKDAQVQAISGRQSESGPLHFYARIRPDLKVEKAKPFTKQAIFLLDTSLSEHPDRFDLNMKLLKAILESDKEIEKFNVLTFNVGTAWVEPKGWLSNNADGRETVFKRLDGLVLEGATDVSAALNALNAPPAGLDKGTSLDAFVLSDGQITWGDSDATTLVTRFEAKNPFRTRFHCYRTSIGADNLELFSALTRRGGGTYNCFKPDDVATAAKAHQSQCLQIESVKLVGGPASSDVLVAGRKAAVYPGGDLVVTGRLKEPGKTNIVIEGTFNGQKYAQEYPIEVKGDGELAPRGWGEVAVASLLALNDSKLDGLVTAYCQQFSIGSRAASFLILENDNDYKRFNLEEERGKTLNGDMAKFLTETWAAAGQPLSAREEFVRFLKLADTRVKLFEGAGGGHVGKLLALLKDGDFELPEGAIAGALLHRGDVPAEYLTRRDSDPRDASTYLTEAKRRALKGDADGAARVLSSVIEQHPGRGDALRLVGYRLLDLKQPAQAARLFSQVQRQRPFEPHSYRDLARSLEDTGKYALAAVQYEIVLAGTWHNRFHDSLKQVTREEYAAMMRDAIRRRAVSKEVADLFGERLEALSKDIDQSELRVTIAWNTDDTDVDLWVIEPDGTKCFYSHKTTTNGGELSQDMTQGYGPERYRTAKAMKGTYRIVAHYYRANPNLIAGETHVNVVVTRFAGTPQETVERKTVILKKQGEEVEVGRVEY
jgi:von Willebrand factor type A domain